MVEDMNNMIGTVGFMQEIHKTKHVVRCREMIIDHVWNNCPRRMVNAGVNPNSDSDQDIVGEG